MVLGMLFENFKNVHILRYVIYEFLKKVLGGPRPTCLVRVHCALLEWRTLAEELWRYRDTEIEKYRRASRLLWLSGTEGSAISVYVTI